MVKKSLGKKHNDKKIIVKKYLAVKKDVSVKFRSKPDFF